MKAQRPESHLGVSVLPLLPYYRQLAGSYMTHSARPRADRPWFDAVPEDKAIELITFRNGFEPDAQYLALQGFHGRRYSSIDANAILRFYDRGHVWLYQNTEQWGHYFRNALCIGHGLQPDYYQMPGAVRLDAHATLHNCDRRTG